ncbi:hypothetical protein ACNQ6O_13995 [Marinobacter sp. SBS5]|uniref:hypothetical protein n=1 Tax=Marinobacter sp. SBS5 TaxID=3401754 RepID=UPI003AAC436D
MSNNVHPLQEATVHLLDALYRDKHLAVTSAMLTIQNGHYPSVQAILETLRRYEDEELVVRFIESNGQLVEEAREYIANEQAKREAGTTDQIEQASFGDIFGAAFQTVKPFELLKGVRLSEIEDAFSKALTELCGEELSVSIGGMEKEDSWREQVNLQLGVVARSNNR